MPLTGFFRITWTVQLAVGVALFGVSFWTGRTWRRSALPSWPPSTPGWPPTCSGSTPGRRLRCKLKPTAATPN